MFYWILQLGEKWYTSDVPFHENQTCPTIAVSSTNAIPATWGNPSLQYKLFFFLNTYIYFAFLLHCQYFEDKEWEIRLLQHEDNS